MRTVVKDFSYRGRHYTIVNDGKFFMAVEDKFLDKDGKTIKPLNYTDGLHTNHTLDGCIADTKVDLDIKHYVAEGMTTGEAYCKAFNITKADDIEAIKIMFCEEV